MTISPTGPSVSKIDAISDKISRIHNILGANFYTEETLLD
jgi:hypothetical protein